MKAAEINTVGGVVEPDSRIAEGMPVSRLYPHKAWVSIMYGCNNFCSYCIVPYLRGRERSRNSEDILKEIREVVADGCKDITLLGQNVNSYGEMTGEGLDFADLLAKVAEVDGDFLIRFMTSHQRTHPRNCWIQWLQTRRLHAICIFQFNLVRTEY